MLSGHVSLFAAFSAGFLSFVSPCVLPLVPSYVSYMTGLSLEQLTDASERRRFRKAMLLNSVSFLTGFSCVFIAFGASASLVGQALYGYQDVIRKIGAVLIVAFGLVLLGALRWRVLMTEHRLFSFRSRPVGYLGSFMVGTAFAAAWTPCVGPILGAVLAYAGTAESMSSGILLLTAYSLGLGLPLFVTAFGVDRFLNCFHKTRRYLRGVSAVSGVCLVVVGVLLYMDSFARLTGLLERNGIGWYIGQ